jgi:hypothetical protein
MNKIIVLFLMLLFTGAPSYADYVDEGLGTGASEQLKAGTREMIKAGVDSKDAVNVTRAMNRNRFRDENIIRAQEIVKGAVKEGLPVGPVMNKAFEAMSKGVSEQGVVRAMENIRERYSYAYKVARKNGS